MDALELMSPTGNPGFEQLVAGLLWDLTGTRFRIARSGPQDGKDLESDRGLPWSIAVECKKYRKSTKLDQRELLIEIDIAVEADPTLDLWVLAASREVDANLVRWMTERCNSKGIDCLVLACGTAAEPGNLDVLCAESVRRVLDHCVAVPQAQREALKAYLAEVRACASFQTLLRSLRDALSGGTVGFPVFRNRLNQGLAELFRDELSSRARLNAKLNVAGHEPFPAVDRREVRQSLDDFLNSQHTAKKSSLCVVHGDEGNGKSWAVAAWVHSLMQRAGAPAVFWLTAGACTQSEPLGELALYAKNILQAGRAVDLRTKLHRWSSEGQVLLLVVDGINERNTAAFWTKYLLSALSVLANRAAIVVTCRSQTWRGDVGDRLGLQPHVIEVPAFSDEEFAGAISGVRREDAERLWHLGSAVRKPRYLADAIEHLRTYGSTEELTIERLLYDSWKSRVRSRSDYPLNTLDFEVLLRQLGERASHQFSAREIIDAIPYGEAQANALQELASGGVLRRSTTGAYVAQEPYLAEGLSLVLLDALRQGQEADVRQLREQVGQWINDTHGYPLTGRVCASAATKALLDPDTSPNVCIALTIELLQCQNVEQPSIDGALMLAARKVEVLCGICEELWKGRGVDHAVERALLRSLVLAAKDEGRASLVVTHLTRWAGFIHLNGDHEYFGEAERSPSLQDRVKQLAPEEGLVVPPISNEFNLVRVENQRLVRLARLALAVVSFVDRRTYFPVLLACLVADAVVEGSRTAVVYWILASSREPLDDIIKVALDKPLTGISDTERSRVRRVLLSAGALPGAASELIHLRQMQAGRQLDASLERMLRNPERHELQEYFVDRTIPAHIRLAKAKTLASDPTVSYPEDFVQELAAAVLSFDASARRLFRGMSDADHQWESFESLLCRVDKDLLALKLNEFALSVRDRQGDSLYCWSFSAEELTSTLLPSAREVVRSTWQRLAESRTPLTRNEMFVEGLLLGMLLPWLSSSEQVSLLLARPSDACEFVRITRTFRPVKDIEEQKDIARRALESDKALGAVLWFASTQGGLAAEVWLPVVQRGVASASTVERGLALELLSQFSAQLVAPLLDKVDVGCTRDGSSVCSLERHFGTLLLLHHGLGTPTEVLSRCDLHVCGHLLGTAPVERRPGLLQAFANLLFSCFQSEVFGDSGPMPEVPMTIRTPSDYGVAWPTIAVDSSRIDTSYTFRSEMGTWGGLPSDETASGIKGALEGSEVFDELQEALTGAMSEAFMRGDWEYAAFWADETLRGFVSEVPNFLARFESLMASAVARRKQYKLIPFANSLCRLLIRDGSATGWRLLSAIARERSLTTFVDGWSGENLLDKAVFSSIDSELAAACWLQRIEEARTDADLLQSCELLVDGGNRDWLLARGLEDLETGSPYLVRRAILFLAAATVDDGDFEARIATTASLRGGLEAVLSIARQYRETGRWMEHWVCKGVDAKTALDAYCAATLLLHCADPRVWKLVSTAAREVRAKEKWPVFLDVLSRDAIRNAVKRNSGRLEKTLFGLKLCDNDAAPWVELER